MSSLGVTHTLSQPLSHLLGRPAPRQTTSVLEWRRKMMRPSGYISISRQCRSVLLWHLSDARPLHAGWRGAARDDPAVLLGLPGRPLDLDSNHASAWHVDLTAHRH